MLLKDIYVFIFLIKKLLFLPFKCLQNVESTKAFNCICQQLMIMVSVLKISIFDFCLCRLLPINCAWYEYSISMEKLGLVHLWWLFHWGKLFLWSNVFTFSFSIEDLGCDTEHPRFKSCWRSRQDITVSPSYTA